MSDNDSKKTREIFLKKPYLKKYFELKNKQKNHLIYKIQVIEKSKEFVLEKDGLFFASQFSPKIQAERQVSQFKFSPTDIIVVIGLGNPYLPLLLAEKVGENQILIIIEENKEVLFSLWDYVFEDIFEKSGKHIFCGEDGIDLLKNYIESLPIERIKGVRFIKNKTSYELNKNFYNSIEIIIKEIISARLSDLLTKFEFEKIWLKNSICNLSNFYLDNPKRYKVQDLKDLFSSTPAVLVSAGPDLKNQCETLKKIRDKVFILSCDTSLKVLLKFNIIPDSVITLDAQLHSLFHFLGVDLKEVPLFADFVSSPSILSHVHFCSIIHSLTTKYIMNYTGEWKKEITAGGELVENYLGEVGGIQSGGSVATTGFDLLRFLGFSSIFLFGQDLAYSGREIHSTGTFHNEKWKTLVNRKRSLEKINEEIIQKRDITYVDSVKGGKVLTDYVLNLYRKWFEESGKVIHFPVYNVNSQGAKIQNLNNISSNQCIEILENQKKHEYFWKKFPQWSQNNTNFQHINSFQYEFNPILDTLILEFSNTKLESQSYDFLQNYFSDKVSKFPDLKYLIRKMNVYILRNEEALTEQKKVDLFLKTIRKELKNLKRKIRVYSNAKMAL